MRTVSEILADISKVREVYVMLQQNGVSTIEAMLGTLGTELASATGVGAAAVQAVAPKVPKPEPSGTSDLKAAVSLVEGQTASDVPKRQSTTSSPKASVSAVKDQTASEVRKGQSTTSNPKAAVTVVKDQTASNIIEEEFTTAKAKAVVRVVKHQTAPDSSKEDSTTTNVKPAVVSSKTRSLPKIPKETPIRPISKLQSVSKQPRRILLRRKCLLPNVLLTLRSILSGRTRAVQTASPQTLPLPLMSPLQLASSKRTREIGFH